MIYSPEVSLKLPATANDHDGVDGGYVKMSDNECPFCGILNGVEKGTVIARDDEQGFALIQSLYPEGTVHWIAVPFEHIESTAVMEASASDNFLSLIEYALAETKQRLDDYPHLQRGFTLKMHFGGYETVPHAKVHVLSVE
jgi:diadenosine tetraphosphate (Ap4A) HIT family hydrolase